MVFSKDCPKGKKRWDLAKALYKTRPVRFEVHRRDGTPIQVDLTIPLYTPPHPPPSPSEDQGPLKKQKKGKGRSMNIDIAGVRNGRILYNMLEYPALNQPLATFLVLETITVWKD